MNTEDFDEELAIEELLNLVKSAKSCDKGALASLEEVLARDLLIFESSHLFRFQVLPSHLQKCHLLKAVVVCKGAPTILENRSEDKLSHLRTV